MGLYILQNGEQTGPFDEASIQAGLRSGRFAAKDLAWEAGMGEWQPLETLFPVAGRTPLSPPPVAPSGYGAPLHSAGGVPCRVCGQGELVKRRIYRMSTPAVVIGYLALIPSILGVLMGLFVGLVALSASAAPSATANQAAATGVIGGGFALLIIFGSVVGSLLGWLLTMKKRVLQCQTCSATIAAS